MDCSATTSHCAWTTDGPGRNNKSNRAANKFGIMEGGHIPDGAIRQDEWLCTCGNRNFMQKAFCRQCGEQPTKTQKQHGKDGGTSPRQAPPKEPHIERRTRKSPTSNNSRTGKRMCKWAMWSKTPRRRTGRTLEKCGKHTKLNNCENASEQMMKWRRAKLHQKRSWEPHKKAMLCVFNNAPIPLFLF